MLCEGCQEREATGHSTLVIDGVARSFALCDECMVPSAGPEAAEFFAAMKTARCIYCGGVACSGGMDAPEITPGGKPQMKYWCRQCMNEGSRYWQQLMHRLPQDLPREEQLAVGLTLLDELDRHMREWVAKRGS